MNQALDDQRATPSVASVLGPLLHRLATPAGTLVNYLYLLEDDPSVPSSTIEPMQRATEALRDALEDARKLVDAGEMRLAMDVVDPVTSLEQAASDEDHVEVVVHTSTPRSAVACPEALRLLFGELLRALAPLGDTPSVEVRTGLDSESGRIRITAEAHGAGTEPPDAGDVGLAVAATLARRMGGTFEQDAGSRVVLTLRDGGERIA